jgi:dTDP-glucose pyrophosphorylase
MKIVKELDNLSIDENLPIKKAVEVLDKNGFQILLLHNREGNLSSIVTDGDLRRFLLNDGDLNNSISLISNKDFTFLTEDQISHADKLFKINDFNHLPVIDKNKKLKYVLMREGKDVKSSVPVVIVAGGIGSRLSPMTKIIPKPLMPVGDMTILEKIIENFYLQGFNDFRIIINYKKDLIKAYMSEIDHPYDISFIEEKIYGGTAGCLRLLKDDIEGDFIVTNCDILTECSFHNLLEWHQATKADLTVLGVRKKIDIPYGVLNINEDYLVETVEEKPSYNNLVVSGVYTLNSSVLKHIPKKEDFGMDVLIRNLIQSKKLVSCFPINEGWHDMGQFDEYKKLVSFLENK